MTHPLHPVDRFAQSGAAVLLTFAWGFAEATVFFIVPDVLLSLIGCRSTRASFKASGAAVLGALLGGSIMYAAGSAAPEGSRSLLVRVPAVDSQLIQRVQRQLSERGLGAVLAGPTLGIPYKIYALEWGARRGNLPGFLLISIPARGIRFLLAALLARGAAGRIAPWTRRSARAEITILALFWAGFYAFYFHHFGW